MAQHEAHKQAARMRGKLVVIEGIDGAGKSTVARCVTDMLVQDGCDVVLTREPSTTACGTMLRSLLQNEACRTSSLSEYFLFAADRAAHLVEVVEPALRRGAIVLCDRMGDSSIAYQGYGRGVDRTLIATCNRAIMQDLVPDLTIYLAIDYATAQERLIKRAGKSALSAYDREQGTFFQKVIKGYEELYADRPDVIRIEASDPLEQVVSTAYHHVCMTLTHDHQ